MSAQTKHSVKHFVTVYIISGILRLLQSEAQQANRINLIAVTNHFHSHQWYRSENLYTQPS